MADGQTHAYWPTLDLSSLFLDLGRAALVTGAYYLLARLGRVFTAQPENISVIWPASGLTLAALLLTRRSSWPLLLVGTCIAGAAANLVTGAPPALSTTFAVINTAEALLAAMLINRLAGGKLRLDAPRGVMALIGGGAIATSGLASTLVASIGAAMYRETSLLFALRTWWISDALGIALVTPLIMVWAAPGTCRRTSFTLRRAIEVGLAFSLLIATSQYVFSFDPAAGMRDVFRYSHLLLPLLLWITLRFDMRFVSLALALSSLISLQHTAGGRGPFMLQGTTPTDHLLAAQAYAGIVAASVMSLSAALAERARVLQALHESHERLAQTEAFSLAMLDEQRRLAVLAEQRAADAVELDRLKDQFVRVAAHELKTPVAIMKGRAQLLLRSADERDQARRKSLDAICRGADRIDKIIEDLVDVSQLQLGRLDFFKEDVDLSALVGEIAGRVGSGSARHQIRLIRPDSAIVHGDPRRLAYVIRTLVDNAIRYSPDGGDIDIELRAQGDAVELSVRDRGIGIPASKQARIFERFYRAHTDTPHDRGGMGVGLFLSRGIVAAHGGTMWFESQEAQGSKFTFRLPSGAEHGARRPPENPRRG